MARDRIGVLGGTFNPVHKGHIELGQRVGKAFGLKRILYILSAKPPHKKSGAIAPPALRFQMLCRSLRPHHPYLQASDIEIRRPETSYTVRTLRELRKRQPQDIFYFITGSEGFLKIRTWKEYREVLRLVFFIIVLRSPEHRLAVCDLLREENIPCRDKPGGHGRPPLAYLCQYDSPYLHLSSTRVRRLARAGQRFSHLVEPQVESIMEEKHLYETQ